MNGLLVAAGVILAGYKNQSRVALRGLLLRSAEGIKNSQDGGIRGDHADSDRGDYSNAENERHEKRNHTNHLFKFQTKPTRKSRVSQMPPDPNWSMSGLS